MRGIKYQSAQKCKDLLRNQGWKEGIGGGRKEVCIDGWMDGWVDKSVDGWMDGWINEWMGGWMDGQMNGWVVA